MPWPLTSHLPASSTDSSSSYLSQSPFPPLLPQGDIQYPNEYSPLSQRNKNFSLDPWFPPSSCPPAPHPRGAGQGAARLILSTAGPPTSCFLDPVMCVSTHAHRASLPPTPSGLSSWVCGTCSNFMSVSVCVPVHVCVSVHVRMYVHA